MPAARYNKELVVSIAGANADAKRPIDATIPLLSTVTKQTYEKVCYAEYLISNGRSLPPSGRLAPQKWPFDTAICIKRKVIHANVASAFPFGLCAVSFKQRANDGISTDLDVHDLHNTRT